MKKKCLIIGGAGFIGKNVANYLVDNNFKVKIIDKYVEHLQSEGFLRKSVEIGHADVNDIQTLIGQLGYFENVIWLVHTTVPSNSMIDLNQDLTSNILPLINFLTAIKDNPNIERFIYLSSGGTVYGNQDNSKPVSEENEINPISNYGLTKYIAEKYIRFILGNSNISSYILRPSNVYGPYQNLNKPQGIIGHAFKAAINGHPLFLYNNGEIVRDFLHVNDLSDAIFKCITKNTDKSSIHTYNIGSNEGVTMKEIIHLVNEITNNDIDIVNKPQRSFDCNYNVLDCTKFRKEHNWEPNISLKEGLLSVWNWVNEDQNL